MTGHIQHNGGDDWHAPRNRDVCRRTLSHNNVNKNTIEERGLQNLILLKLGTKGRREAYFWETTRCSLCCMHTSDAMQAAHVPIVGSTHADRVLGPQLRL